MSAPAASSPAAAPDAAALVLATHNAEKLTELRVILEPLAPDLDPRSIISAASLGVPEPVEDGLTFAANAEIKACALMRATGLPAVADARACAWTYSAAPPAFSQPVGADGTVMMRATCVFS